MYNKQKQDPVYQKNAFRTMNMRWHQKILELNQKVHAIISVDISYIINNKYISQYLQYIL